MIIGPEAIQLLFDVLLKGGLLMGIGALAAWTLRRRSAALRHLVWSLTFAGLLALPICSALMPSWQVPISALSSPAVTSADQLPAASDDVRQVDGEAASENLSPLSIAEETNAPVDDSEHVSMQDLATWLAPFWNHPRPLAAGVVLLWAAGGVVLMARLLRGMGQVIWMSRRGRVLEDPRWQTLLARLKGRMDVERDVRLITHEAITMPMTWGLWQTTLALPAGAEAWPEERREVVLMHELAHVKRFDYPAHLIAQIARAVHWVNPLVWHGTRRLLIEREKASDDHVISAGLTPSTYARQLVELAQEITRTDHASLAAPAMARPSEIRSRVLSIIEGEQERGRLTRRGAIGTAALLLGVTVLIGSAETGSEQSPPVVTLSRDTAEAASVTVIGQQEPIEVRGRLLGSGGQPMRQAHVNVLDGPSGRSGIAFHQQVDSDGRFSFQVPGPGGYLLWLTGAHHQNIEVPLLVQAGAETIELELQIPPIRFRSSYDNVYVTGDFNGFSDQEAIPLREQPSGMYAATIETAADTLAYQLLGMRDGFSSRRIYPISGTGDSRLSFNREGPFWDTEGDYYSVIEKTPGEGVTITFDPGKLPRSSEAFRAESSDPIVEGVMRIFRDVEDREARAGRFNSRARQEGTGERYDWTSNRQAYRRHIAAEERPLLRQYMTLRYIDEMQATEADSALARRFLREVPPTSPFWSLEAWSPTGASNILVYLRELSGQTEMVERYIQRGIARHPDEDVRRQFLYRGTSLAHYLGDREREERYYAQFMEEFGESRQAEWLRKRLGGESAAE